MLGGANSSSSCVFLCVQDFVYHGLAVLFYLSAGVDLAFITMLRKGSVFKLYQINIAAVVRSTLFCHLNTKTN